MSELSGAELAEATAKAIDKRSVQWCRDDETGVVEFCHCVGSDPMGSMVRGETLLYEPWRPDLGGAAGAEVLDWAYTNIPGFHLPERAGLTAGFDLEAVISEGLSYRTLYGDTVWIALCRAVVAFKEAQS